MTQNAMVPRKVPEDRPPDRESVHKRSAPIGRTRPRHGLTALSQIFIARSGTRHSMSRLPVH